MSSKDKNTLLDPKYRHIGPIFYLHNKSEFIDNETDLESKLLGIAYTKVECELFAKYLDKNESIIEEFNKTFNRCNDQKLAHMFKKIHDAFHNQTINRLITVQCDNDKFEEKIGQLKEADPHEHELINYIREHFTVIRQERLEAFDRFFDREVPNEFYSYINFIIGETNTHFIAIGAIGL